MSSRHLLFTCAIAALTLAGCGPPDNGVTFNGGEGPAVLPDVANRGEALFARFCSACHGADATGSSAYRGSIQGAQNIADMVRNGANGMPANPLDDREVAAIEGFLAVLAGAPIGDPGATPVGGQSQRPADGQGGGTTPPSGGGSDSGGSRPPAGGNDAGGGDDGGNNGGGASPPPAPDPAPRPPPPNDEEEDDEDEDDDADEGEDD